MATGGDGVMGEGDRGGGLGGEESVCFVDYRFLGNVRWGGGGVVSIRWVDGLERMEVSEELEVLGVLEVLEE